MMVYSIFRYSWLIILKNCFDFHELAIESWMVFLVVKDSLTTPPHYFPLFKLSSKSLI
jgi:hypothetical protein